MGRPFGRPIRCAPVEAHRLRPRTPNAFYVQAGISFGISLTVTVIGIAYLHDSRWVHAFLAPGLAVRSHVSFHAGQVHP